MSKVEEVRAELRALLGEGARLKETDSTLRMYGQDQGDIPPILEKLLFTTTPQVVVSPRDEREALLIIEWAKSRGIPLIPRGSASYAFGGVVPVEGGVIVDLASWDRILEVDAEAQTTTVETGVRWAILDDALAEEGLTLQAYPTGKFSTVGGWVATGGLGIGSLMNGHLRDQIVSLRVLTPQGEARTLQADDPDLEYFIGTEGQMGFISQVTLRVRTIPTKATPVLLYCDDEQTAMDFAQRVVDYGWRPFHIKYLDRLRISQVNDLLGERLLEESGGLLLDFDSEKEALEAAAMANSHGGVRLGPEYLASYLWQERLFSMKVRRLGRGLLATEVILPWEEVAGYCRRARTLGLRLGAEVACEVHLVGQDEALVIPLFLSAGGGLVGFAQLMLVMMLTQASFSHYGRPYGVGIWFTPFVKRHHKPEVVYRYREYKRQVDPGNIFNPGKYFSLHSKFWNLPGLIFHPRILELGLKLLTWSSPVWGAAVRWLSRRAELEEDSLVSRSALACSRCGSCTAVCPASMVMDNEGLAPRGKLWVARERANHGNWELSPEEARSLFFCLRCGACERVCQSQLPLTEVWDELEESLEGQFDRPNEAIGEFIEAAEDSDEYWEIVRKLS